MCRMIGFLAIGASAVAPYFGELQRQAESGWGHPHATGWGADVYGDNTCWLDRHLGPVYEQVYDGPVTARAAVLHARKASDTSTAGDAESLHPFQFSVQGVVWSFAHNGTIWDVPPEWRRATDSKAFVDLLEQQMKSGKPAVESLRSVVSLLRDTCRHSSLNCFLMCQTEFLAVRSSDEEHQLFYRSSDHLFEASTEVPPGSADSTCDRWIELGQEQVLHATALDGRIELELLAL
jgi:predicted glutamine amidotransferase